MTRPKRPKVVYVPMTMNAEPELAARTREAAAREGRPVSGFLKWVVRRYIAEQDSTGRAATS